MKTLILFPIVVLLVAAGCRTDPGPSDYDAQEEFAFSDAGVEFLLGPDPWNPGEDRLFLGIFYEAPSGFNDVIPINNLTNQFFIFEVSPGGPLTCEVDADDDRIEGFVSNRVTHAGFTFWGVTIAWLQAPPPAGTSPGVPARPEDLSFWETLHISLKSRDAAFEEVDIALSDFSGSAFTVSATDYGYTNDGAWHTLDIPFSDFVDAGLDLSTVTSPLLLSGGAGADGEVLLVDNFYYTTP